MNQALIRKMQKMQKEMMETQKELEQTIFPATAGGVVSVEVFGTKELNKVVIADDFEASDKEDLEMLADMIVAACNEAYRKVDKTTEEKMAKYNALLGGMGGMF